MTELTLAEATDNIYASLQADNQDIGLHIATLKAAMARDGVKEAELEISRLAQPNRQGRKVLIAFFRQRGVTVKLV